MFKLVAAILITISTLGACSSMSGYPSGSMDGSSTAIVNPPRSAGEGPSFTPYGAAGH